MNSSRRRTVLGVEWRVVVDRVLLVVGLALGGLLAYVDARPAWDDTGVTAAALLVASGALGYLGPRRPWLWALGLGIWIPLLGIARAANYATLLALAVAFVGAYGGKALRSWLSPARP